MKWVNPSLASPPCPRPAPSGIIPNQSLGPDIVSAAGPDATAQQPLCPPPNATSAVLVEPASTSARQPWTAWCRLGRTLPSVSRSGATCPQGHQVSACFSCCPAAAGELQPDPVPGSWGAVSMLALGHARCWRERRGGGVCFIFPLYAALRSFKSCVSAGEYPI